MKLAEAWRLSRPPYKEIVYKSLAEERGRMWWGGFGRGPCIEEAQSELRVTKKVLRIAKFDKLIVAVFNVVASVLPFTMLVTGSPLHGLPISISLSLAITFGLTTLYAIQTFSSFVGPESSTLLATLPLSKADFSLITLLSFVRSVDYLAIGAILGQVVAVAYLTVSPLAMVLMLTVSLMNVVLAVAIALWFVRIFYKNLSHGGKSGGARILRFAFILMWGALLFGVGFLFSVPWLVFPLLERMLLNPNQISSLFFYLLHPFSSGIAIATLVYPATGFSSALMASLAMVGHITLAGVAGKWVLATVKRTSQGSEIKVARKSTLDLSIKTYNPLRGYVMKDLRVSSRSPSTAFFFALPIVETIIVSLLIVNLETLRASAVLVATFMGGICTLLTPLALLNGEGKGLEYTKTLPVRATRIIASKTLITVAAYMPVPLALLGVALVKPLISSVIIFIPYFIILAVASASVFEIKLFLGSAAKGEIAALVQDLEKLIVGVLALLIPEVAYAAMYLMSVDHILAILTMGIVTFSELAVALHLLKRG